MSKNRPNKSSKPKASDNRPAMTACELADALVFDAIGIAHDHRLKHKTIVIAFADALRQLAAMHHSRFYKLIRLLKGRDDA